MSKKTDVISSTHKYALRVKKKGGGSEYYFLSFQMNGAYGDFTWLPYEGKSCVTLGNPEQFDGLIARLKEKGDADIFTKTMEVVELVVIAVPIKKEV